MRKQFAKIIYEKLKEYPDLYVLTGDLGMFVWDDCKRDFPDRFINVGAAEQAMLDIAVGLSYAKKRVICYSITPFLLYRPFEALRTYINHEQLPVLLVGSGRNQDYAHDGFSHDASDDWLHLHNLSNIYTFWPNDELSMEDIVERWFAGPGPAYINLKK